MTLLKKPIARAMEAAIRIDGRMFRGAFHLNDFGGDSHLLEGVFQDAAGDQAHFRGRLSGVRFKPVQKGRPKGDGALLDVGLMLCHVWHQRKGEPQEKARPRRETLHWWLAKGWPGASDEQALNKRIRAGNKVVKGMEIQRFEPFKSSDVATLIAMPKGATVFKAAGNSVHVTVDGRGWVWRSDHARAQFGRIRYEFVIEQSPATTIEILNACQG